MKKLLLIFTFCLANMAFAGGSKSFMFNDLESQNIQVSNIESYFQKWFLLNQDYSFQKVSERIDGLGLKHVNYKEFYKGYEVEDALIMVHAKDDIVYCVNGQVMQNDASRKPEISQLKSSTAPKDTTLKVIVVEKNSRSEYRLAKVSREGMNTVYTDAQTGKVLRTIPLMHYAADMPGKVNTVFNGLQDITNFESGGVYYLIDDGRKIATLDAAYASSNVETLDEYITECDFFYSGFSTWARPVLTRFRITASTDWWGPTMADKNPDFFIVIKDQYGRILYTSSVKDDTQPPMSFYPNVELNGEKFTIEVYEEDVLKNDGPFSVVCANYRDGQTQTCEGKVSCELYFKNSSPEYDAHWGMEKTYDYYLNTFNRKSFDDEGSPIYNILNCSWFDDFNAAAYTIEPFPMFYGKGGIFQNKTTFKPFVSLDIMAHEFTHLVTSNNGNGGLKYEGEAGALNESFSDIFATCIEFYAKGKDANWLIGDGLMLEYSNLRDMSEPKNGMDGDIIYAVCGYPQPDTYGGDFWQDITAGDDNGGVHRNSGVQNYWFYLLCEGGSGVNDNHESYNVQGIGMADAQQIAYRNLMTYLTPSATHRDACDGSIQAARDLFGKNSKQEEAIRKAWQAVGVSYVLDYKYLADLIQFADSLLENTQVGTSIGQFGAEEHANLSEVLSATKDFVDAENNTQQEIYSQCLSLEIAIDEYLETRIVDKTVLQSYISVADSLLQNTQIGTKPGQYGQQEYRALQKELDNAEECYDTQIITQAEIDFFVDNLKDAIENYENSKVPVNTTQLISIILRAETLLNTTQVGTEDGQYGQAEYVALNNSKRKAEALLKKEDATQSEIDAEHTALSAAINTYLRSKVGYTGCEPVENALVVRVGNAMVLCNVDDFQIIDVLGRNVTMQNGKLKPGTYMVKSDIGGQKIVIK